MKSYKRIFTIVIDSLGIGVMPNAAEYDGEGTDTLGHIDDHMSEFQISNLTKPGLANLHPLTHAEAVEQPMGYYGRLLEASVGKDTMTSRWEMMGPHITKPFQTSTNTGFPQELLDELSRRMGHKIVGNKSASGIRILDELAEHEITTGDMIVYTSADSVLQVYGNKETFGPDESYRCCEITRELTMKDERKVSRVITRPYVGKKKGEFKRTSNRHGYVLKSYGKTVPDALKEDGYDVISAGKMKDIFDGKGITEAYKSKSSVHGTEQTLEIADKDSHGLCSANPADFDALWGHRRNSEGYRQELERFDVKPGELLPKLQEDDLLLITTDYGNDPTYKGADHTKEMVLLSAYSPSMTGGGKLPDYDTFVVIGAIVADNFKVPIPEDAIGTSVSEELSQ